jgi:hypothetical protein
VNEIKTDLSKYDRFNCVWSVVLTIIRLLSEVQKLNKAPFGKIILIVLILIALVFA